MRLINADELHEIINWTHMKPPFSKKTIHRFIDMARTVEAEPIKHSRWIYGEDEYGNDGYFCEECGEHVKWDCQNDDINFIEKYEYCPYCGAKMDVQEKEE